MFLQNKFVNADEPQKYKIIDRFGGWRTVILNKIPTDEP
jgi:hypothetical protein